MSQAVGGQTRCTQGGGLNQLLLPLLHAYLLKRIPARSRHSNVRPSTCLVAALPLGRTLVAAADALTLVPSDAPQDKQQVAVQLAGRPTCAAVLSPSAAVVGDAGGRLTLLDLEGLQAAPLAPGAGLPPAAPTCLAFLPAAAAVEGAAAAPGALFVGSSGGGVFLRVPPAALAGAPAAAAGWQPVGGGDAALLAAGLGPVLDCCAVPDPSGSGDTRLLMCCGAAPFSRLALAHLAAHLVPLAVGGGDLPVSAWGVGCRRWGLQVARGAGARAPPSLDLAMLPRPLLGRRRARCGCWG